MFKSLVKFKQNLIASYENSRVAVMMYNVQSDCNKIILFQKMTEQLFQDSIAFCFQGNDHVRNQLVLTKYR